MPTPSQISQRNRGTLRPPRRFLCHSPPPRLQRTATSVCGSSDPLPMPQMTNERPSIGAAEGVQLLPRVTERPEGYACDLNLRARRRPTPGALLQSHSIQQSPTLLAALGSFSCEPGLAGVSLARGHSSATLARTSITTQVSYNSVSVYDPHTCGQGPRIDLDDGGPPCEC